jgi:hypothetical protein
MIDMEIKIGDRVKVVDQEIRGEVIRYDGQKIVILDDEPGQDLEDGDEPTLVYRAEELEHIIKY